MAGDDEDLEKLLEQQPDTETTPELPNGLVEQPQEKVAEPEPRPEKLFLVQLPGGGSEKVYATDAVAAVAKFNELCGIMSTAHQHDVIELEE